MPDHAFAENMHMYGIHADRVVMNNSYDPFRKHTRTLSLTDIPGKRMHVQGWPRREAREARVADFGDSPPRRESRKFYRVAEASRGVGYWTLSLHQN